MTVAHRDVFIYVLTSNCFCLSFIHTVKHTNRRTPTDENVTVKNNIWISVDLSR